MRMEMKMGAVSAISLLLLCSSAISSADSKDSCNLYAATGSDVMVPMFSVMDPSYTLKWSHNNTIIFYRKKEQILRDHSVSENGSLKLTNVKESDTGSYISNLYDSGGIDKGTKVQRLCVIDPPPKPSVKFDCKKISDDKQLEFTCVVPANPADGLRFEWLLNNLVLGKETRQTLKKPVEQVKTSPISCKVSNLASSMASAPVTYNCNVKNPKPTFPAELWGINTWIFVGAGGGLVLILIILVIVCCICTKRRKRMRLKEEGELRLAWTNDKQHHSHPPDDHHHHHPHHPQQQQPAGHTGPRQQRSRQQRPRGPDQPKARPQPSPRRAAQAPPGQIDEEQPPPLPQPRKNATKTRV